jgi:phenylacetate-CoA ligase
VTSLRWIGLRAHRTLSAHVLVPLYDAYRRVRPGTRAATHAYRAGLRFRAAAAHWSDERRREWMLHRLREVLRRAAIETSYYGDLFRAAGFDPAAPFEYADFARLPVLERAAIRDAGDSIRTQVLPSSQLRRDATGGSSGAPTEIWLGPEERGWRESGIEYFMRRIGVPRGSGTGLLWIHHLDPLTRSGMRERALDWIENAEWFDCVRLSPALLDRYHAALNARPPRCIIAYAGVAALLAERAEESGRVPQYPTVCFVTGAEKLHEHERALIERTYQRPVHERYGSRDVGLIGFQTDPSRDLGFDIDWANVLIECETIGPTSSILVTKLHADGMPMIRYRLGDLARFPDGSRPGEPVTRLLEVTGRETDRLWLPDGRSVHGIGFPHLMKDFPVADFQVLQRRDFSVTIYVVPRGALAAEQGRAICDTVRANLPGLAVTLELVDSIARTAANKRRPVVSEVQASDAPASTGVGS